MTRARRPYGTGSLEQLPSGLYRAAIRVSGFRRRRSFPTKTAARNWLDGQMGERAARIDGTLASRGSDPGRKLRELRDAFLEDLRRAGRTERTIKGYRSHVDRVLEHWGELALDDVDGPQLEFIVAEMHRRKWKPSTIRNRVAALVGMVKLGQRTGLVAARALPVRRPRITLVSRPEAYRAEEVGALLAAAEEPWQRCTVLLGADAGLRLSEIPRVRKGDLSARTLTLSVPVRDAKDRPKSGKGRMVPVTKRLARAIAACPGGPETLVVGRPTWNTPDQLAKLLEPVWLAAGVRGGTRTHRLRHYWATTLANDGGATPWELMEWGGWASLDMVRRYYHAPITLNRRPVEALEKVNLAHGWPTGKAKARVHRGKVKRARAK